MHQLGLDIRDNTDDALAAQREQGNHLIVITGIDVQLVSAQLGDLCNLRNVAGSFLDAVDQRVLAQLQHACQGVACRFCLCPVYGCLIFLCLQNMQHLFQCNQLHVPAGGCCFREIEGLVGVAFFQLIQHADFRPDDKFLLFAFGRMLDDACGGADVICQPCHSFRTFGMHQNLCIGVCVLQLLYLGRRDILYEDLAVVCYINSTAEIKSWSDVSVTSANAVQIVRNLFSGLNRQPLSPMKETPQ